MGSWSLWHFVLTCVLCSHRSYLIARDVHGQSARRVVMMRSLFTMECVDGDEVDMVRGAV